MTERDEPLDLLRHQREAAIREHLANKATDAWMAIRIDYGDYRDEPNERFDVGRVNEPVYQASLAKAFVAASLLGSGRELTSDQRLLTVHMLERSDNDAYRQLVDQTGAQQINDFMQGSLPLRHTGLRIREDGSSFAGRTTAAESSLVFRYLLQQADISGDFGLAVRDALEKADSRYGVRIGMNSSMTLLNKTGTDFTTVGDEECGNVAVAHDVGFIERAGCGEQGLPLLYSITSASDTVSGARRADRIMNDIGSEMAVLAGGLPASRTAMLAQRAMRLIGR